MNKDDLRKVLKPLIKECIKEVIFEDGTLSTIISEVALGLGSTLKQPIVETKKPDNKKSIAQKRKKDLERRRRLLDAAGREAYNGVNLFEGTTPAPNPSAGGSAQTQGPLSGIDPSDPGVDISSFVGHTAKLWERISGK